MSFLNYFYIEQKTGGGEADIKKLTPTEEKLMSLLSWIAVRGADINEVCFEDDNVAQVNGINVDGPTPTVAQINIINVDKPTPNKSFPLDTTEIEIDGWRYALKRLAEPIYSQVKGESKVEFQIFIYLLLYLTTRK